MAPLLDLNQVNPSHVFVLLFLLVGGSMVHRALAQNVGPRFAPVAFSFGTSPLSILRRCNANYLAGWIPFSLSLGTLFQRRNARPGLCVQCQQRVQRLCA
jgi:hypothetical protein